MLRISSLPLSVSFTPPPQPDSTTTTTTLGPSHPLPVCLPPSHPPSLPRPPLSPLLPSPVHFAILFLSPSRRFKAGVILSLPPSLFLFSSLKKQQKKKKNTFPSRPPSLQTGFDSHARLFCKPESLHWPSTF